jgi:hypothetical protein
LDKNDDGQLTEQEIPAVGQGLWKRFVENADRSGDGKLNLVEFTRNYYWIAQFLRADAPQMAAMATGFFRRLDTDADGLLRTTEVPEERRRQFRQLMAFADSNNDGALTLEEYTKGVGRFQERMAASVSMPADKGDKSTASERDGRHAAMLTRIMQLDANADGKVQKSEAKGPLERNFKRIDADGNAELDRKELERVIQRLLKIQQDRPQPKPAATDRPE